MQHDARQHAKYGSSRIHRVRGCAGYVSFAAGVPSKESDASEEGTKAHEFLSLALQWGKDFALEQFNATYGHAPSKSMIDGYEMVSGWLESLFLIHGELHVVSEVKVYFPQTVVPDDDAAGIADLMVVAPATNSRWAVEYKFGVDHVSELFNPQLMYNSCGAWWDQPMTGVTLVVIQPNGFMGEPIREHFVTALDLALFQRETEAAIARAEGAGELTPGPHCRYCECELVCPRREQQALAVIEVPRIEHVEGLTLPQVQDITPDRLAYILRHADALRTWLKAAENHAFRLANEGHQVPEHKLVETQERRQFRGEVQTVAAQLSALTSYVVQPETFTKTSLVGVIEAEKILTDFAAHAADFGQRSKEVKAIKERMAFLTPRDTSGNLTLVHISDRRPAKQTRVASGFAGVALPPPPTGA